MEKESGFRRVFKNTVFPRRCGFCRRFLVLSAKAGVCDACFQKIPFSVSANHCKRCGRPIPMGREHCFLCARREFSAFKKVYAAYLYQDLARNAVIRFKKERNRSLAPVFVRHMAAVLEHSGIPPQIDLVVAVPPRTARMKRTRYDQAECLARTLARELELPFVKGVLRQKENRKKQSSLSFSERRSNVLGNFEVVKPLEVTGKTILLVDDICTTGATLKECSKMLKQAGAGLVFGTVAAIVPDE